MTRTIGLSKTQSQKDSAALPSIPPFADTSRTCLQSTTMASEPRVDATSTILETIAELCRQGEMNLELGTAILFTVRILYSRQKKSLLSGEDFSTLGALHQGHLSGLPNLSVPRSP